MKRWVWILATCVMVGGYGSAVWAADRPSHLLIPDWFDGLSDPSRASEMLQMLRSAMQQRPGSADNTAALQNLLELIQRNDLEGLQRAMQNPLMREQMRQMRPDDPNFRRQVEEHSRRLAEQGQNFDVQRLEKFLRDLTAPQPADPNLPLTPPTLPPGSRRPWMPEPTATDEPGGSGFRPSEPPDPPTLRRGSDEPNTPSERFRELLRRAERWVPDRFRRSEAVERFWSHLRQSKTDRDGERSLRLPGNIRLGTDWTKPFARPARWASEALGRIRLGRMPSLEMPDLSRGPSLPTWGGGASAGSLKSVGLVLGLIGTVMVVTLLGWRLWNRKGDSPSPTASEAHLAGQIDLRLLSTREELVRVFDDLTVSTIGPQAVHWNHRRRARGLADVHASHRDHVHRLADIYESARYAPPDEGLSQENLIQARNDLLALTGAGDS